MPYKSKTQAEWEKESYLHIMLRLRRVDDQKIIDAVEDAAILRRTTKAEYAKAALVEKLIRDGYLEKPRK